MLEKVAARRFVSPCRIVQLLSHARKCSALRDDAVHLSVLLLHETDTQNAVFSKTKQFRAMVSIDDQ